MVGAPLRGPRDETVFLFRRGACSFLARRQRATRRRGARASRAVVTACRPSRRLAGCAALSFARRWPALPPVSLIVGATAVVARAGVVPICATTDVGAVRRAGSGALGPGRIRVGGSAGDVGDTSPGGGGTATDSPPPRPSSPRRSSYWGGEDGGGRFGGQEGEGGDCAPIETTARALKVGRGSPPRGPRRRRGWDGRWDRRPCGFDFRARWREAFRLSSGRRGGGARSAPARCPEVAPQGGKAAPPCERLWLPGTVGGGGRRGERARGGFRNLALLVPY